MLISLHPSLVFFPHFSPRATSGTPYEFCLPFHSPLTNCSHKGLSQLPELCSTPHQAHLSPPRQRQPESSLSVTLPAVPPGEEHEVTVPNTLNVLNGSDARLPCTFNSCYTVNHKQFSLEPGLTRRNNCS